MAEIERITRNRYRLRSHNQLIVSADDLLDIANYVLRHRQQLLQEAASEATEDEEKDKQSSLFINSELKERLEEGEEA